MTLAGYLASAVILVSSFFILSTYTEELLSSSKITTFLPHSPFDKGNCECASNPIP